MSIRALLHWLYCLPIPGAVALVLMGTMFFLYFHDCGCRKPWWRLLCGAALLALTGAVLYLTVSNREAGSGTRFELLPFHSYREVMNGGNREILRSNFMNGLLFYPVGLLAGALLPRSWPFRRRVLLTVLFFAALSVGIEFVQFQFSLGRAEIDDVLHNTLGTLLGSCAGAADLKLSE